MGNTMKIFISYTIRDEEVDLLFLKDVYRKLSSLNDIYIDLLHNNEKSQQKVINELISSDRVIVIETSKINDSPWVKTELRIAKKNKIPIVYINKNRLLNGEIF